MKIEDQIADYISCQSEAKQKDLETLHQLFLKLLPKCKLWFLDGKDQSGKIITHPNIGYGLQTLHYANGTSKDFYQIGMSANTSGISVYIMGLSDKKYLSENFGKAIGKAKVTGYCINFKTLQDIHLNVLEQALQYGLDQQNKKHESK